SSRRRHTSSKRDWSSDVCSSDLGPTSMTPVFSWISALSSTSLMTFRSVRKFCPRLFLNEKPWSSSICFVLPAVAISFILLPRQFFQYIRYTCFVDIIPVQLLPQL